MTKAEKLEAAWSALQSTNSLQEMFEHVDAKYDQIEAAIKRLQWSLDSYREKQKNTQLERIAQQMQLGGVELNDLADFLDKKPKPKSSKRRHIIMAVINGQSISTQGILPKWVTQLGYKTRPEIPEKYFTDEYKELLVKQGLPISQSESSQSESPQSELSRNEVKQNNLTDAA